MPPLSTFFHGGISALLLLFQKVLSQLEGVERGELKTSHLNSKNMREVDVHMASRTIGASTRMPQHGACRLLTWKHIWTGIASPLGSPTSEALDDFAKFWSLNPAVPLWHKGGISEYDLMRSSNCNHRWDRTWQLSYEEAYTARVLIKQLGGTFHQSLRNDRERNLGNDQFDFFAYT